MGNAMALCRQVSMGGQPTETELRTMAAAGVRSIVNLSPAVDAPAAFPVEAQARLADQLGLAYLELPVPLNEMRSPEKVDEFIKALARLPRPVHVHCRSGWRAGIYAAIALGVEQGLSGAEALARVRQLGFDPGPGDPAEFIVKQTDGYLEKTERSGLGIGDSPRAALGTVPDAKAAYSDFFSARRAATASSSQRRFSGVS